MAEEMGVMGHLCQAWKQGEEAPCPQEVGVEVGAAVVAELA